MHPPSTPTTTPTSMTTPTTSPAPASAPGGGSTEDGGALGAFLAEVDEWLLHIGARVAELERRHWMHRAREGALLAGAGVGVGARRVQAAGRVV